MGYRSQYCKDLYSLSVCIGIISFMGHFMNASNVTIHSTVINYTHKLFITLATGANIINTFTSKVYVITECALWVIL